MNSMPQVGRLAAHVLLDGIVAWDDEVSSAANSISLELATARLNEIGAVPVKLNDNGDEAEVEVNISNLVFPAIISMRWLVVRVSAVTGETTLQVVSDLRGYLDEDES